MTPDRMQSCITYFIAGLDCTYPIVYALFISMMGDALALYADNLLRSRGVASKDSIHYLIDLYIDRYHHYDSWIVARCAGACGFEDLFSPILKTQYGFIDIIDGAIAGGRIDVVEKMLPMHGDARFQLNSYLESSVTLGRRDMCEFFLNCGAVASTWTFTLAYCGNQRDIADWLMNNVLKGKDVEEAKTYVRIHSPTACPRCVRI
jgi:hypothetical protein